MDFQDIRKEYENQGIEVGHLADCPLKELRDWIKDASDKSPGPWFEANAMSLATAGSDGAVSVRCLLLKGILDDGIQFFTNYDSNKAKQMESNPNGSVAFHWPHLGRQIRLSGPVEKTSREVSEKYFHSRPRGAQIGASISKQSSPLESRHELEERMKEFELAHEGREIPLPENWGGYLMRPIEVEFWQGKVESASRSSFISIGKWPLVEDAAFTLIEGVV